MTSARTPLSRDRIIAAALEVIDRDGLEAVSMRRLGEDLGVEAMSLYHHVANKTDLLDGIFERVLSELPPPAPTRSWRVALRARAQELRAALRRHPNTLVLFATRPAVTPASIAQVEATLEILHRGGFDPEHALAALHILVAFIVGHTLASYGPRRLEERGPSSSGRIEERASPQYGRVTNTMPRVRDAVQVLPRHDPEREFELGVDALLAGLARHARR